MKLTHHYSYSRMCHSFGSAMCGSSTRYLQEQETETRYTSVVPMNTEPLPRLRR